MKKRANWLVAAAAAALMSSPAAATQWASYHWAHSTVPVHLNIYHTFRNAPDWSTWYGQAVADWGDTAKSNLALTDQGAWTGTSTKKCDPISGAILVCSDAYGQRGWLGIASIWASGDHITQATTKLNDTYYASATYNTPGWRDLVTCQEIGHDFGLDHQDETFDNPNLGTCMDYTNNPDGGPLNGFDYGPANRQPNGGYPTADYDTLTSDSMYSANHVDSGGGGGGGGGGCNPHKPGCAGQDAFTFREVGRAPATPSDSSASSTSWGRAIGYDRAGRPNTFRLDLGNGRSKLTHVFWVKGFHPSQQDLHD